MLNCDACGFSHATHTPEGNVEYLKCHLRAQKRLREKAEEELKQAIKINVDIGKGKHEAQGKVSELTERLTNAERRDARAMEALEKCDERFNGFGIPGHNALRRQIDVLLKECGRRKDYGEKP